MGTAPDYNALAAQAGAISSTPAPDAGPSPQSGQPIDYNALAKQSGAITSTSPTPQPDEDLSEYGAESSGPQTDSGFDPATYEQRHPTTTSIGNGLAEAGQDIWGAVKSTVSHPIDGISNGGLVGSGKDLYRNIKESIPVIQAYENARASGKGIMDSLSAANDQAAKQDQATQMLKQRIDEFKKNPTQATTRAVGDAAALATSIWAGNEVTGAIAPETAATTADATGAETATAEDTMAESEAPESVNPTTTDNPIEQAAQDRAAKSGLKEGYSGKSGWYDERDNIQDTIQSDIRGSMSDVAEDAGVEAQNPQSIRDVAEATADQVLAKSKAAYAQLDEASGGRWQRFDDQLSNIRDKMKEVAGVDDDKYAQLEDKQSDIETSQAQLIEDLKASGKVDPALADEAAATYKQAQALYDVDAQIKASTTGRAGVSIEPMDGGPTETIDTAKLAPRLHKLYDRGRLQQAVGEDTAYKMIQNTEAANGFVSDAPLSTGQQAMKELLQNNSANRTVLGGVKTNYVQAYADFNKLSYEEQIARFGKETPQARNFLKRQARNQILRGLAAGAAGTALATKLGLTKALIHAVID